MPLCSLPEDAKAEIRDNREVVPTGVGFWDWGRQRLPLQWRGACALGS